MSHYSFPDIHEQIKKATLFKENKRNTLRINLFGNSRDSTENKVIALNLANLS